MLLNGTNYCDFCFAPLDESNRCTHCALTHETYKLAPGLLAPGTNIQGKYIIGRVLGRGGFGATYIAFSSALGKAVAVKEYLPVNISYRGKDEEMVSVVSADKTELYMRGKQRFIEEAQTIRKFRSKDEIVSVYEQFDANNTAYFSMEYLEGVDFRNYITAHGGKLKDAEVVKVMSAVCNVLVWVHSTLLMHRDVAPDNIFICNDGRIKLIDFGAARQAVRDGDSGYSVVLKHGFAPPEQYITNGNQGPWTDIYSVGATMYFALTGNMPPNAPGRINNATLDFDGYAEKNPQLMAIICKCMAPDIHQRYQNALEVIDALNDISTQEKIAVQPIPMPIEPKPSPVQERQEAERHNDVPVKPINVAKPAFNYRMLFYVLPITFCLVLALFLIGYELNQSKPKSWTSNSNQSSKATAFINDEPYPDKVIPPKTVSESIYSVSISNASWLNAGISAQSEGGQLVCINSREEFEKVCQLADEAGLSAFWAGAYIEYGEMWENAKWVDGTDLTYTKWYPGEPSYTDKNTGDREDYMLIFKVDDIWYFNDAMEDVSSVFKPGKLGYIVEKTVFE